MSENKKEDNVEEFTEQPTKVEVTIKDKDGKKSREKELEEELEQARIDAEDYRAKLELIAEKEFERKKREAGAPAEISTPEELMGFIQGKFGGKKVPAGNIPLTPAQTGEPYSNEKEYATYEEMLQDLHYKEKHGTPEEKAYSKSVLDELVKRSVKQVLTGHPITGDEEPEKPFKLEPKKRHKRED